MFMEHSNVPGVLYAIAFLQVKNEAETERQSCHMQNRREPTRTGDRQLLFNVQICGAVSAIAGVHQQRQNCNCGCPLQIFVTISLAVFKSLPVFLPTQVFL